MKLNLGCGDRLFAGYIGVDVCAPAEQITDLNDPWPWPDNSVEEVLAYDVFEHLVDKNHTLNELWRVLKPGGIAQLQVPDASEGDGADCDPTHRSRWNRSSFEYVLPGCPERERFRNWPSYPVRADFEVVKIGRTRHERRLGGFVMEMQVTLRKMIV